MMTLSIIQPWASLIVLGHKKIETRGWNARKRGKLLIHAAKKRNNVTDYLCEQWSAFLPPELPRGCVIGMVDLADCKPVDQLTLDDQEHQFGDYSPGRFGLILDNPVLFHSPIPYHGMQGFWEFPDELLPQEILQQIDK